MPTILEQYENPEVKDLHALARLTETAERFEDMCEIMGALVKLKADKKQELEVEDRNMLSVAYKNVVGQRRSSWRILHGEDEFLKDRDDLKEQYAAIIEKELRGKCDEVLQLLEKYLVKENVSLEADKEKDEDKESTEKESVVETQVFYLKMCGDYYRYLAEFCKEQKFKDSAAEKYQKALDLANKTLKPTHPTRLGLALNASVCYYEILKEPKKACTLAKKAFDDAIQKLDSLSDSTYKDSTLIMQLLRDNLTIWTSEESGGPEVEEQDD
eukprot:UN06643